MVRSEKSCPANAARRPGRPPCFCGQCIFIVESWRHIARVVQLHWFFLSGRLARSLSDCPVPRVGL